MISDRQKGKLVAALAADRRNQTGEFPVVVESSVPTPSMEELQKTAEEIRVGLSPEGRRGFISSCLTQSERSHPIMQAHLDSIK